MAWIAPIPPSPRHPKPRWQVRYQDGRRQRLAGIYNTPAPPRLPATGSRVGFRQTLEVVPTDVETGKAQSLFGDHVEDVWWPTWEAQHRGHRRPTVGDGSASPVLRAPLAAAVAAAGAADDGYCGRVTLLR
jgi:hypothetical protein